MVDHSADGARLARAVLVADDHPCAGLTSLVQQELPEREWGHLGQLADDVPADRAPLASGKAPAPRDHLGAELGQQHGRVVPTVPEGQLVVQLSCEILDTLPDPDGQPPYPLLVPAVHLPRHPLDLPDLACQPPQQLRPAVPPVLALAMHAPLHDHLAPRVVQSHERADPGVDCRNVLCGLLHLHLRELFVARAPLGLRRDRSNLLRHADEETFSQPLVLNLHAAV